MLRQGVAYMILDGALQGFAGNIRPRERPRSQRTPLRPVEARRSTYVDPRLYDRRTALSLSLMA